MRDDLNRILELESENRSLRNEVKRLKKANLIYSEANFSKSDLGEMVLPNNLKNQAG